MFSVFWDWSTVQIKSQLPVVSGFHSLSLSTISSFSPSHSVPSLFTGWKVPDFILKGIDTYMTAPTCLNQSVDIFLQPSPYEAVELIVYALKYSPRPVDILVLGPLTNIAAAITRDRSIVPKIGTLYVSGKSHRPLFHEYGYSFLFLKVDNLNQYPIIHHSYPIQL